MTLKELARMCKVSPSTVSRVVNGDLSAASPAMADTIWRAVHESGYLPNQAARQLKTGDYGAAGRSLTLACVFARAGQDESSSQFFWELFRIMERECLRRSTAITAIHPPGDLSLAALQACDGLIVLGRCPRPVLQKWRRQVKNIVSAGLNALADSPCDQVVCDGYEAAKLAVRHLLNLGHRRIAYIGEQAEEARWRGYFDALHEGGLPVDMQLVFNTRQSLAGGRAGALALLTRNSLPSGVFCANDITAMGVLKAFSSHGIKVPRDISVVSIDNTLLCESSSPMLTSINIPKEDLARLTVLILLDRIHGGHQSPVKLDIPFTLLRRESCQKPHNERKL